MSSEHLSYTIHSHQHHFGWDNSIEPIIFSKSGDLIEVDTVDSSGSQLSQNSTINDVSTLDFSKVNPVTGPIYIHDAKQGDTIEVEIIDFHSSGWGWTAIIPGFGLLNDIFNKPDLHIWKYDKYNLSDALFSDFAKIPLSPFVGTIGLSLKEKGLHSIVPPRNCGGNIDIKNLTKGSKLYLPVQVDGGLLSLGDTHAAQLETFSTNNIIDQKGHFIVTGIGPDLFESSKNAVQEMIELLVKKINITPSNAYMLCSVCADLKISEIVDIPNLVVTCHLPKYIFD